MPAEADAATRWHAFSRHELNFLQAVCVCFHTDSAHANISIVAKVPSRAEFTTGRVRGQVIEYRLKAILAR